MQQPCRLPVVAFESLAVPLADVGPLRSAADPNGSPPLPKRFLRHADEQSVVAVRAVQQAVSAQGGLDCRSHGVIAAPCQAGRIASSRTLSQYATGGGVTVSTHIVPQSSMHAVAAAVSVGLGMHGPSLGVGGGVTAVAEGLLTAAAFADTPGVDGWWLVASELRGEPRLTADGEAADTAYAVVEAVALFIAPAEASAHTPRWWLPVATSTSEIATKSCTRDLGLTAWIEMRLLAASAKEAA
ncbi:MAG: hypothetical protein ISQ07_09845 [Pirellulales bacterium]|nr:hypothetical protein [Pirellulales bacterium]